MLRSRIIRILLLKTALICLAANLSFAADQATSEILTQKEVALTFARFELRQGKVDRASQRLSEYLQDNANDHETWNILGLIEMKKNDFRSARTSFEKAIDTSDRGTSGRGIYFYNLADAYIRSNDVDIAKSTLQRARNYPETKTIALEALQNLKSGVGLPALGETSEQPLSTGFSLGIALSSGFDSNVLLLSDRTLDSVSRSNTQSAYAGVIIPLGFNAKNISAENSASYTRYLDEPANRYSVFQDQLNLHWAKEISRQWQWGFQNSVSVSFVNTDGYQFYHMQTQAGPELKWSADDHWNTLLIPFARYQKFNSNLITTSDDDRTGYGFGVSVTERLYLGNLTATFGANVDRAITEGKNFKSWSYQAPLSVSYRWAKTFSTAAAFRYARTIYGDTTDDRTDSAYYFKTQMTLSDLLPKTSLSLSYSYSLNDSSRGSASYSKHSVALLAGYQCF